jgi:hypothetical protein
VLVTRSWSRSRTAWIGRGRCGGRREEVRSRSTVAAACVWPEPEHRSLVSRFPSTSDSPRARPAFTTRAQDIRGLHKAPAPTRVVEYKSARPE